MSLTFWDVVAKKIRNNSYNFLCCGPHSYYVMEMTEKIGAKEKISQMGVAIISGSCSCKKSASLRTVTKLCLISFLRKDAILRIITHYLANIMVFLGIFWIFDIYLSFNRQIQNDNIFYHMFLEHFYKKSSRMVVLKNVEPASWRASSKKFQN